MKPLQLSLALAVLIVPALAFAAAPTTFQGLANLFVNLLDNATAVLIVAGIVVYFYGISTNILKFGEGDTEKFKNYFFWGIIVLFVMVSIWGILHLLQDTLFGGNAFNATNGAPQQPATQFQSPAVSRMTMRRFSPLRLLPLATLSFPALTLAQDSTVSRVVGVFNVLVGLMLTVALLTYFIGVAMWAIRLGTWPSYRTVAIRVLEWSVAVLFTLVVLLAIVQFFQKYPYEATYVLSAIVIILIIWVIVYLIAHSGGEEKKEEH